MSYHDRCFDRASFATLVTHNLLRHRIRPGAEIPASQDIARIQSELVEGFEPRSPGGSRAITIGGFGVRNLGGFHKNMHFVRNRSRPPGP